MKLFSLTLGWTRSSVIRTDRKNFPIYSPAMWVGRYYADRYLESKVVVGRKKYYGTSQVRVRTCKHARSKVCDTPERKRIVNIVSESRAQERVLRGDDNRPKTTAVLEDKIRYHQEEGGQDHATQTTVIYIQQRYTTLNESNYNAILSIVYNNQIMILSIVYNAILY